MPPTSAHRFVAWTRLGNKSKEQLHRPSTQDDTIPPLPKDGREKGNNAEAADPLPFRDSANVGQSNSTPRSNGEDEDTETPKDGAIIGEYVTVPSSPNPRVRYCPHIFNGQSTVLILMHRISLPLMLIPLFLNFRQTPSKAPAHSVGPGNDVVVGSP